MIAEKEAVSIMQEALGNAGFVPEDIEPVPPGGGAMYASVDTLVQSTDMPGGMGYDDAGWKSVAACVSDFAAKGIRPGWATVSLNLPDYMGHGDVGGVAAGVAGAAERYGIRILGGDVNGGRELSISVCMLGRGGGMVRRGGAGAGDAILATGPFGYAGIALEHMLGRDRRTGPTVSKAIKTFLRPEPRLEFALGAARYFTSAMDSSDGLEATLCEMARQSGRGFELDVMPTAPDIVGHAAGGAPGSLDGLVFRAGEEYETVFTCRPADVGSVMAVARSTGAPVVEFGRVGPAPASVGTRGVPVYPGRGRRGGAGGSAKSS